jgi:hypothetical protein
MTTLVEGEEVFEGFEAPALVRRVGGKLKTRERQTTSASPGKTSINIFPA